MAKEQGSIPHRHPILGAGQIEAHQRLQVTSAPVGGRVNWRGVRTDGLQSSSLSRRGTTEVGEACGMVSWAGMDERWPATSSH
jgi:hypothetical protein